MAKRRPNGSLIVSCSTYAALARALARAEPAILRVDPDARDVREVRFLDALVALKTRTRIAVQLTRDDAALEAALSVRGIDVVKPWHDAPRAVLRWGPLELDATMLAVRVEGAEARLPPQLFRLLSALVSAAGAIVPRTELLGAIGYTRSPGYDLLGRALHRLRAALGASAHVVRVERGRGVRLCSSDHSSGCRAVEVLSLAKKSFPLHPEIRAWLAERAAARGEVGARPRSAQRAAALLALDDDQSPVAVARLTRRTVRNVRQLRARYLDRGPLCIDDAPRTGRPKRRV